MAKKSASKGKQIEAEQDVPAAATDAVTNNVNTSEPAMLLPRMQVTKVNTANLVELKNALDDLVKEFFSLPAHNFKTSHAHEDTRLLLGWTSVVVALGTTYYAYKHEFQESKFWVGVGVAVYVALNTVLALYVTYVEKNIIYEGKRRTFASRITTERLTISSVAASSPTHATTSSWIPFPLSLLAARPPLPPAQSPSAPRYPLYTLELQYTHSANANKSLLNSQHLVLVKGVGELFDEEGRIARGRCEEWLKEGLERVVGGGGLDAKDK
ncbi:hypothetical protein JCM10212_000068 [Sporobolomyces blumeae]